MCTPFLAGWILLVSWNLLISHAHSESPAFIYPTDRRVTVTWTFLLLLFYGIWKHDKGYCITQLPHPQTCFFCSLDRSVSYFPITVLLKEKSTSQVCDVNNKTNGLWHLALCHYCFPMTDVCFYSLKSKNVHAKDHSFELIACLLIIFKKQTVSWLIK